ncbi:alpha/beta hydrolase [Actinoplanes sp. NPDC004185]
MDAGISDTETMKRSPRRRLRRVALVSLSVLVVLAIALWTAFQVSPWPAVLVLRATGNDGLDAGQHLARYVPPGITQEIDRVYDPDDPDGRMDVIYPSTTDRRLPTVVWVHGGAFIAGTKSALPNYLAVIASHGYTVANVEYTVAPEAKYPGPILQLNKALRHLQDNADRLHVDPTQFVLAGDSAGGQIAGQAALAISEPAYADKAQLSATITPQQLRAVILTSAATDIEQARDHLQDKQFGWFLRTVMWAYSGKKNFADDPRFRLASLPQNVTANYPPTFITTGPYDPLLSHSEAMAQALRTKKVDVDALFFDRATTDPGIGHEYALDLDTPQAREAMKHIVALLRAHTTSPQRRQGVSDAW